MKIRCVRLLLAVSAMAALTDCGGGGGGDRSSAPNNESEATAPAATERSFWSLDDHTYYNGGYSNQSAGTVGGKPITIIVVATATLDGGDKSNGEYSGSNINVTFYGSLPGTFNVVKDKAAFVAADASTHPIQIECNVGTGVTTGATMYTATGGQVVITKDADGKFHVSSEGALPAVKTLDLSGGVHDAPTSMALSIQNAY